MIIKFGTERDIEKDIEKDKEHWFDCNNLFESKKSFNIDRN